MHTPESGWRDRLAGASGLSPEGGSGWTARSAEGGYCSARVYPATGVPVAARKSADVSAGTAPISGVTVRFNSAFMQTDEVWDHLAEKDKHPVRAAVAPRPIMSDAEWSAMIRRSLQAQQGGL